MNKNRILAIIFSLVCIADIWYIVSIIASHLWQWKDIFVVISALCFAIIAVGLFRKKEED